MIPPVCIVISAVFTNADFFVMYLFKHPNLLFQRQVLITVFCVCPLRIVQVEPLLYPVIDSQKFHNDLVARNVIYLTYIDILLDVWESRTCTSKPAENSLATALMRFDGTVAFSYVSDKSSSVVVIVI